MRIIYTFLVVLLLNNLYAQTETINSPFVISNAGDTWIQNDYILCFTLGELVIETFIQQETILTQGFHQEDYHITQIIETNNHNISIYPNPTKNIININCNLKNGFANLFIRDVRGSIIHTLSEFPTSETQFIELSHFSQGIYFMEIILNSEERIIYQIQKIN